MQKQKRRWSTTTKFIYYIVSYFIGMLLIQRLFHEPFHWPVWIIPSIFWAVWMIWWEHRKERQV